MPVTLAHKLREARVLQAKKKKEKTILWKAECKKWFDVRLAPNHHFGHCSDPWL